MSPLEKIIYIADYIEPERKHAKRTSDDTRNDRFTQVRRMAYRDLDEALYNILGDSLAYLHEKGDRVDYMTQKTYEYYLQNQKQAKSD